LHTLINFGENARYNTKKTFSPDMSVTPDMSQKKLRKPKNAPFVTTYCGRALPCRGTWARPR